MYKSPFDWDFSDDKSLIMIDPSIDKEEIQEEIQKALDDFDIKLEGQDLLYKLMVNGQENGSINIPEDQFLKSATYDSDTKKFTFVVGDSTIDVNAADMFDGLATSDEIAEINEKNIEQDEALGSLATKEELQAIDAKVDAIVIPDVSEFAVKSEVTEEINSAVDGLNQALADKADKSEIPDVSGFAVKSEVTEEINAVNDALATFETQVDTALGAKADKAELEPLAVKTEVTEEINSAVDGLSQALADKADKTDIPSIEGLAVKSEVTEEINAISDALSQFESQTATALEAKVDSSDLETLATKAEVEAVDAKVDAIEIPPTNRAFHEDWPTNTTIDDFCSAVSDDPEAVVGESYLGELTCNGLPTGMGNGEVKVEVLGDVENKILLLTVTSTNLAPYHWELTYIDGDKYGWRAWVEDSSLATVARTGNYADLEDKPTIPTNTSELNNDSGFITSHQSLEDYATKEFVSEEIAEVVGGAPSTLDTLKEIADALTDDETTIGTIAAAIETKANASDVYTKGEIDNKIGDLGEVVEVEAQEATYWQEGDDLPDGVSIGDVKTSAVAAVTREKSVKEYVDESVQTVNEKPEVVALQERMNAMENALKRIDTNAYQTMMNDLEVLDTLKDANAVTIEEGTIGDIIIPTTTKSKTINGELEPNASLTLNSRYGVTINNTGSEPTDLEVNAPAVEGYNAATITLNGGEYDTITVTDASLTVQNGATVQNVVITEETTKNLTINAMFAEGATITSNSDAAITLTSKNPSGEEVSVVLDAPGATVTMSGGSWVNVDANVSPNTLIINKNVHIDDLNVTQGNVVVKVARQADIANVIGNYTLAEGCTIDHLHDEITDSNVSNLTATGTHTLIEDIVKNGRFAPGIFASDDIVWNLNGHNITFTNTQGYANFLLRGSLHLEINGQGNVVNNAGDYGFWAAAEGVKIVVNGGNFEAATHVLYAEKGTIEVNGGSFKLTNWETADKDANGNFKFLLNCKDENYTSGKANIIVRGGKFYDFDPANCAAEGVGTSFVAEGYGSVMTTEIIDGVEHRVYEVKPINE